MKSFLITCLLACISIARAQDTVVSYLDKAWKKTKKENAVYYRKQVKIRNEHQEKRFLVLDYYMTDTLQMSGYYKDRKLTVKDGAFVYYYENGQKSEEKTFVNGTVEGNIFHYYESGVLSQTVRSVNGHYEGKGLSYFENGQLSSEVFYHNNKFDGICKWYYENGQPSSIETYEADSLISFELFLENGEADTQTKIPNAEAEFPGGLTNLKRYLANNIIYPEYALEHNIEGKVFIQFIISKTGEVSNVTVKKSAHILLDQEAVRVLENLPKWKPAKFHNRVVPAIYNLPVTFRL